MILLYAIFSDFHLLKNAISVIREHSFNVNAVSYLYVLDM